MINIFCMKAVLERNLGFVGYPEYSVDTDGNVWALNYKCSKGKGETKQIKPAHDKKGYLRVSLKGNTQKVHRLIAMAFIPNPNGLPQVNHKNEIKDDNRVCNLEWCDNKYNCSYGTKPQRTREQVSGNGNPFYGKRHNKHTKTILSEKISKPIIQYNLNGDFMKEWKSCTEVDRVLGYDKAAINRCCHGKQTTSYGYMWRYKKEDD